MFNDVFKKEDEEELERIELEAQKKTDITGDLARRCLELEQFGRYKEQYTKAEASVVDTLLAMTKIFDRGQMDFQTYGIRMHTYMTRLQSIRALLDTITNDSKKGLKELARAKKEEDD